MKCDQCGYKNADVNNFCEECGNKLSNQEKTDITGIEVSEAEVIEKSSQIEISVLETGELVVQLKSPQNEVSLNGETLDSMDMYVLLDGDVILSKDTEIHVRL